MIDGLHPKEIEKEELVKSYEEVIEHLNKLGADKTIRRAAKITYSGVTNTDLFLVELLQTRLGDLKKCVRKKKRF